MLGITNISQQHGESLYNLEGRIGGDTLLSERGEQYARKLPQLVRESVGVSNLRVGPPFWCLANGHRMTDP